MYKVNSKGELPHHNPKIFRIDEISSKSKSRFNSIENTGAIEATG